MFTPFIKAAKIKTVDDFLSYDADTLSKLMKCGKKLVDEALKEAREIQLKDSIS